MKICICTTPIRPVPTDFPPFGSMAIIQSLRKIGEEVSFYHIDYHRYTKEQILEYFKANQFKLVGISAVVSTAYAYTKYLIQLIKSVSPNTIVFVGGNLAASSEILHRKAKTDYCIIGDGEIIVQNLVRTINEEKTSDNDLQKIPGITYINSNNELKFTGYDHPLPAEMIERPDFSILEKDNSINYYIYEGSRKLSHYTNDYESKKGEKHTTLIVAKGCVARCTFCHRFEKGYRVSPRESIINHLKMLKDKYEVGSIAISDENFGSYKEETKKLVKEFGSLGLKWQAAGVRAHTIDLETLKLWKANGCYSVLYGIESGSPTMLKVMEKKISLEQNIKALQFTYEAGLTTVVQLVIGMPGETDKTIEETIDFLKKTLPYYSDIFRKKLDLMVSVNYAQALPGTPLYEYARENGFIKKDIQSEEDYLIKISDRDAYDNDHFINYTQQPLLKVLSWRSMIYWKVFREHAKTNLNISLSKIKIINALFISIINYVFKTKFSSSLEKKLGEFLNNKTTKSDGHLNIKDEVNMIFTSNYKVFQYGLKLLFPWNKITYPFIVLLIAYKESQNMKWFFKMILEHIKWSFNFSKKMNLPKETLRKIVMIKDTDESLEIRRGR
jgi:radical SAM superfamily enzyme YgiQ (UPF0313 family)